MERVDLTNFTAEEYEKIMSVMKRDQLLRKKEEQRIFQLRAVSGEWMKELTRSASEKIRSPSASVFATATENLGRSLKYSFRSSFLKQSNQDNQNEGGLSSNNKLGSSSETQLNKPDSLDSSFSVKPLNNLEFGVDGGGGGGGTIGATASVGGVIGPDQSNLGDNNNEIGNNYRRFYRSRGQIPPKLPPTINTSEPSTAPSKSPPADESGDQETSPKPPLSPVIKAYQAAVDLVSVDTSRTMLNSSPSERKTVYRKVSNRLLDSSSSEEDDEEEENDLRLSSHSRASSESTPSPRTPNSCKILSGISANQATAFKFPPLSPVPSLSPLRTDRPLEFIPPDRQSSDEFSTPLSSFRSRSTSSETPEETSTSGGGGSSSGGGGSVSVASKGLTAENGSTNRRVSPLRKQRAIAEEHQTELSNKLATVCQVIGDSSMAGTDYPTVVNTSSNVTGNSESLIRREHSGGDSGIDCNYPITRKGTGSWTSWFKEKPSAVTSAPNSSTTGTISSSSVSAQPGGKVGASMPSTPLATYSRFNQILANSTPSKTVLTSSNPSVCTVTDKSADDSESDGTVENTTGVVFRKVTIKKRLSRTQSDRGSPSPTGSPIMSTTNAVSRNPLMSTRTATTTTMNSSEYQQSQQQPRYTQSPCSSPVPPPMNSTPIHSNQINRSFNDDRCRRPSGTIGTYVKSHSAVNQTGIEESAPSQSFNNKKSLDPNTFVSNRSIDKSNTNQSAIKLTNRVNGASLSTNMFKNNICKQINSDISIEVDEVPNGPHRYTKSDRRSSGMNGIRNQIHRHPLNDKYFQYRLTLPSTNTITSDGYAHHSSYRYGNAGGHHHHHPSHLHHRLKGLSLDSHAFVRRNIARLGSYGSPAKRKLVKFTKKLRRGLLFIASRFKGRPWKGKSSFSDYRSSEYDHVTLERYNSSWLARSVSLPNNSDHHRTLAQIDQDLSWKYGSIDQRLWQLDNEEGELEDDYSDHDFKSKNGVKYRNINGGIDEEYEIGLNDELISGEGKQYQLVYMESLANTESCSGSDLSFKQNGNNRQSTRQRPRILRVRSHLEIADGTAYIEDSDWEMCSDPGELTVSPSLGEATGLRPATSLFKIYHDCGETFNCCDNYTKQNANDCNPGQTIGTHNGVSDERSYCTTLSDPGISLGNDPMLTVVDCPDESEVESYKQRKHVIDQNEHIFPHECGSISSSLLSRSTSPSTPSTLSNHYCPNSQLNFDSSDHLLTHHYQQNGSPEESTLAIDEPNHVEISHIDDFIDNQSTNWNRNRRLDHQVTNWNSGLTKMNNNQEAVADEMNEDHQAEIQSIINQRMGEQPPSRPPRTHRKRHLMESSLSFDGFNHIKHSNQLANHQSTVSSDSIKHRMSSSASTLLFPASSNSSSDLHYSIASNQALFNIIINKHQSSEYCRSMPNSIKNFNYLSNIARQDIYSFNQTFTFPLSSHINYLNESLNYLTVMNPTLRLINFNDGQFNVFQLIGCSPNLTDHSNSLLSQNNVIKSWPPNLVSWDKSACTCYPVFQECSTLPFCSHEFDENDLYKVNYFTFHPYNELNCPKHCYYYLPNQIHQSWCYEKNRHLFRYHHPIYQLIKPITKFLDQHDLTKHWLYLIYVLGTTITSLYNSIVFPHSFTSLNRSKINTVKYLQEYNSNSDCPLNKVKYCLTFDIIRHNWCNTVWTCLNERISETLLMGSIFHPSLLLSTLDSNLIFVNREIYQNLQLIVNQVNMNCQLSGTETGLGNFSQTKPTTSPLPQSSPPSTSPNCLPPPTLPAQSTTTTTPRKISPSSLKPGFIESQVKTTDDTIADVLNDYDNNDDDDDVGKNADCGGTGSRNKKNISRGSNNSWKEAVRPDVEDHNSRVKKAPIRNQSEEESYTRSELENSCKVDQFTLDQLLSTSVLSSSPSSNQQQLSAKVNFKPSELTLTSSDNNLNYDVTFFSTTTTEDKTTAKASQINGIKGNKFNSDLVNGLHVSNSLNLINHDTDNDHIFVSQVKSTFNCENDDQSEHINCLNSNINNQQQQQQPKSDQLFLLTCLPIQPTVNDYKQLSLNNQNNNSNSTNANHNPNKSTCISSNSTLLTVKEVNYDSVNLHLAASNHQHNNNQINSSLPDWTITAETSKTINKNSYNNTRVDKLLQFSSLLLSSPPTSVLSSSPSGLSSHHSLYNHPLILTLCFKHLSISIIDNLINNIVPGLFNNDDHNQSCELTKPTSYLDLSTLNPHLATCHVKYNNVFHKYDHCLTQNQNCKSPTNLIKSNTCENLEWINTSQNSTLNLLSPTIKNTEKSESIDGNCNIVSQPILSSSTPPLSSSLISLSFSPFMKDEWPNDEINTDDDLNLLNDQYYNNSQKGSEDNKKEETSERKMSLFTVKGHTSDIKSNSSSPSSSSSSSSGLLNNLIHPQSDEEEEEYIVDDDNSTSSDESFPPPTLPNHSLGGIYSGFGNGLTGVGNNSNYGNPLAYSLHTIIEESCEESEPESLLSRISETNDGKGGNLAGCLMIPPSSSSTLGDPGDLGDPENYTAFQIGRNVINKRDSFAESETGTDYSDSLSETSENIADFGDEMDPLTLASSRLEKYFTSGLLGSGAYDYPDDVEFQDEPDDLYNQAKRASIKVEMKPNNNKSDESNSNHSNSKLNGIQSISESNVINNSLVTTQATFTPPTIKSLLSSQTESTPTISVDSKLKSSPIITLSTPPTVIHDTTIQSKDDDDDGKKENIEDYFTDTVKRKHINESKSEKDCIPRGHNKENNESQIVNTILNVIEKPLSNNQLIDSSNCVDKVKEILTESSLTKNEEYNKKTDNDELTRNVTIEVRSTTPTKPATPSSAIKNVNLITDNNNTKSTVINNCKTNQSTSRTDSSNSPMSFTKSNYSGDKFNSGYHKKEAAPPVPTIYTPANKPTVESTIRFGPSPQLVRSLLAGNNDYQSFDVNQDYHVNIYSGDGDGKVGEGEKSKVLIVNNVGNSNDGQNEMKCSSLVIDEKDESIEGSKVFVRQLMMNILREKSFIDDISNYCCKNDSNYACDHVKSPVKLESKMVSNKGHGQSFNGTFCLPSTSFINNDNVTFNQVNLYENETNVKSNLLIQCLNELVTDSESVDNNSQSNVECKTNYYNVNDNDGDDDNEERIMMKDDSGYASNVAPESCESNVKIESSQSKMISKDEMMLMCKQMMISLNELINKDNNDCANQIEKTKESFKDEIIGLMSKFGSTSNISSSTFSSTSETSTLKNCASLTCHNLSKCNHLSNPENNESSTFNLINSSSLIINSDSCFNGDNNNLCLSTSSPSLKSNRNELETFAVNQFPCNLYPPPPPPFKSTPETIPTTISIASYEDDDNGSEETRKAPTKCEISPEMEESFVKFVEPLPGKISDYQQMESKTSNKKMTKIINNQTLDEKEEAKDKSKDGKRKGKTEEEKFALKIVSKDLVDDNGRLNSLQTRTSLFTNVERNSTRESEEDDKTVNERQQFSSLSSSSKSPETSLNRSQAYIQLDNVEEENGSFNGDTINTIYERIHDVYQINANPVKHTFNHLHNHFDKHLENDLMEKCSAIIEEKGDLHGFPGKCNPSGEIVQTSRLNHKTILKIDVNGDEDDDDKVNSSDVSLLPKSLVNHNFLSDESTFFDDKYFESNETIKRQQILIPSTKISILTAPSSSTTTRVTTITRGGGRDESTDEDKEVNFNKPNFNNSENEKLESAWETCSLLISRVALKNSSEFDEGSLVGNNIISSSTTETPCSLPMVAIEKSPSSSPLPIIGLRLMADCKIKGKPEHRDTGYYSFQSSDENVKDKSYSEDDDYDNNNYDDNGYKPIMVKTILAGKGQAESVSSTPVTTKVVINCDPQSQNNDNDKPFVASVDDDKNFNSIDYKSSDYSSKKRFTSSSSVLPKILQMDETLAFKKVNLSSIEINSKTDSLASKNDSKQHYQPEKAKHHNLDHHPSHHHHHHVTFNRLRTSFFSSSSGLFRKLASLRDEKSSNRRLGTRKRVMLGGSEPCPSNESTSAVPHISVSDYSESFSHRGSIGSSGEEIFISAEDDIDKAFAYHNRSQTSLSSFGVRSESLSSVYSAAGGGRYGTVTVSGEILFSLNYQPSEGSLELYIKECRNLSPVDSKRNRSDPYVKLYLLPDRSKSGKRKTKVKKHTLNPVFDESLKFYLPSNQTEGRTLWISVWHSDIFGRNDFLGEVTLPLTKEILKNSGLRWYPLQERIDLLESNHNYKGDIFIALKFVPSESSPSKGSNNKNGLQGKLLVLVKEAHNLMPTRSNGTSDPFVKCYLLPDKSKKHKTPVIKKTINPRWNHTFEFDDVTTNGLKDRCLELTVWDYDKLTSNDFLGGVRLSLGQGVYDGKPVDWLDSSEEEMMLWKQMLDRTDMWVYGELCLRSSLQSRATLLR
ncbi:uncharacterized protein LOC107365455 isoform X2 [Tetranychus urticae]|uniref:uncharacterized protein LOC107365455 isoform X2 n=1 Tax=Tetranychus urticae TaxID=32264 RepID=UPI00077BB526|nr:uncharacterized protein LOC107365455 isoform X2 [Tetranychus urticae]